MRSREEKIMIVLMVMALLVLIIAYFGFIAGAGPSVYSDHSRIGDTVILKGEVAGKRATFTGDHLVLTVDADNSLTTVFIHRTKGAGQVDLMVDVGDTLEIIGTLDEYQGAKEIIVNGPEDIRILDPVSTKDAT